MSRENRLILAVGAFAALLITAYALYRVQHHALPTSANSRLDADLRALGTALETYRSLHRTLPTQAQGLDALVTQPTAPPVPTRWYQMLRQLPLDPYGEPYLYRIPARRSHQGYDVYSKGADKLPDTKDDVGNWSGE